jgi:carbonic anhydrase/acetyltransferase-like protein (isoleucine patch superfamily)
MLVARNGKQPHIHRDAKIASSAQIIGDVTIGSRCYVDHNVTIESSGPSIEIGDEVIVFAGSVIRSVGGASRPAFPVAIGSGTLVAPLCALTGCRVGINCYLATNVVVLQGALIGDHTRVGVGAIVHAKTALPARSRIGLRHIAAPTKDGFVSTPDLNAARDAVAAMGFFEAAFGAHEGDQARLHDRVIAQLLEEVHGWDDHPMS